MAEFLCPECGKVFNKGFRFREHLKLKHSGLQLNCSFCSSVFPNVSSRNHHERTVHGPDGTKPLKMGGSSSAYCSNFEIGRFECRECTTSYAMDESGWVKMDMHVLEHRKGLKELIGVSKDIQPSNFLEK